MKKKSFIIRLENREQFEMLTDEQAGKLLKAMCRYSATGELPDFTDAMLKFAFSMFRGQLDRDAEKYEEMCWKNSENGKKGGAPKGNQNAAKKSTKNKQNNQTVEKTSKTSLPKCDSDCERDPKCEPEPDPVCDRECDARAREERHTAHTARQITLHEVMTLASQFGYDWGEAEAQEFLAYNIDKGRKTNWGFAVRKWEENRIKRQHGSARKPTKREMDEMNDYLSVVNNFPKEGET